MGVIHLYPELLSLNQRAISSDTALKHLAERQGLGQDLLQKGIASLREPVPAGVAVEPVEGAISLLNALKDLADLTLVTRGSPLLQREKLKKAGIEPSLFSRLIVGSGTDKRADFESIIKEKQIDPSSVIAVGDRVPIDLSPARALGCYTVHFPNGRGVYFGEPKEDVDCTIDRISALQGVVEKVRI